MIGFKVMIESVEVKGTISYINNIGEVVKLFLDKYCDYDLSDNLYLRKIIKYSIQDIGMRLRPFLLCVSYKPNCEVHEEILSIAAAIELIHISTLVIDDVLDDSKLRNKNQSVIGKWGLKNALTSGMVMASSGFALLTNALSRLDICRNKIAVIEMVSNSYKDVNLGQFLDLYYEKKSNVNEEQYFEMITKSTASFIQTPLVVGAMLWDAPFEHVSILEKIGIEIGIAYQLRDDVIDIIGESEFTGKPEFGDIRQRKMRLPLIHLLTKLKGNDLKLVKNVLSMERPLIDNELKDIINLMNMVGSLDYVINKTKEYCEYAYLSIGRLPLEFEILANHLRAITRLISCFENNPA